MAQYFDDPEDQFIQQNRLRQEAVQGASDSAVDTEQTDQAQTKAGAVGPDQEDWTTGGFEEPAAPTPPVAPSMPYDQDYYDEMTKRSMGQMARQQRPGQGPRGYDPVIDQPLAPTNEASWSQGKNMWLGRLQNGLSDVDKELAEGNITPSLANHYRNRINAQIAPLLKEKAQFEKAAQQQQVGQAVHQASLVGMVAATQQQQAAKAGAVVHREPNADTGRDNKFLLKEVKPDGHAVWEHVKEGEHEGGAKMSNQELYKEIAKTIPLPKGQGPNGQFLDPRRADAAQRWWMGQVNTAYRQELARRERFAHSDEAAQKKLEAAKEKRDTERDAERKYIMGRAQHHYDQAIKDTMKGDEPNYEAARKLAHDRLQLELSFTNRHLLDAGHKGIEFMPEAGGSMPAKSTDNPTTPGAIVQPPGGLLKAQMDKLDEVERGLERPPVGSFDNRDEAMRSGLSAEQSDSAKKAIAGLRELVKKYNGDLRTAPTEVRNQAKKYREQLRDKAPPRMTAHELEMASGGRGARQ